MSDESLELAEGPSGMSVEESPEEWLGEIKAGAREIDKKAIELLRGQKQIEEDKREVRISQDVGSVEIRFNGQAALAGLGVAGAQLISHRGLDVLNPQGNLDETSWVLSVSPLKSRGGETIAFKFGSNREGLQKSEQTIGIGGGGVRAKYSKRVPVEGSDYEQVGGILSLIRKRLGEFSPVPISDIESSGKIAI